MPNYKLQRTLSVQTKLKLQNPRHNGGQANYKSFCLKFANQRLATLWVEIWILAFVCNLSFVIYNLPTALAAATYDFPISFSDGSSSAMTLPFDRLDSITSLDLGNDGTSEILIGSPKGFEGKVYLMRQDGSIINSWIAYNKKFSGGVNVGQGDFDNDKIPEIVTAPASGGGPQIRIFDGFGIPKINPGFFAAEKSNRSGVSIAVQKFGNKEPLSIAAIVQDKGTKTFKAFYPDGSLIKTYPLPKKTQKKEDKSESIIIPIQKNGKLETIEIPRKAKSFDSEDKTIVIDLSDQTLSYFEDGFRLNTFLSSTGKSGYKTPIGEFKILNKTKLAYSRAYGLYMPYWMAFTAKGHGIHELPYWPSGYREGESHLGTAVSHGCVRLGLGSAKELYEWAETGTKVIVQE